MSLAIVDTKFHESLHLNTFQLYVMINTEFHTSIVHTFYNTYCTYVAVYKTI